jgi:NAD+ kinase
MPIDLVLVRHCASVGNEAYERSKKGDHSRYTPEFRLLPNWAWPLSEQGRDQARATGQWLRDHFTTFSGYYCSPFVRTCETAGLLELPRACWEPYNMLRERFWGEADFRVPENERWEMFREQLEGRKHDPVYWRPPGGESLADVELRVEHFLDKVHRTWPNGIAMVVTHRDAMLAFAARVAPKPLAQWRQALLSRDPRDQIHNGQVLHFTRRDPYTAEVNARFAWFRSVCPWDPARSTNEWQPVERPSLSSEELLAVAAEAQAGDWGAGRQDEQPHTG